MKETVVEIKDLVKSFDDRKIIDNISMSIEKGAIFGFFGPNGSGKTTTMRLILGLLAPDSGDVKVLGKNFGKDRNIRRKTGVLLESPGFNEKLTGLQNLEYYARLYGTKKNIKKNLEMVDLWNRKDEKVGKYSTGMKKRLGIARSLLSDIELLFLDEPTTGLDPEAQRDFRKLILHLSKDEKITIFLNTHNLDEAQKICTHIAILREKKIILQGELQNILKKYKGKSLEDIYLASVE
ncbi:MAG: ABC transporter ATP-binding protein [Candidatus Woesearchaeota archaeon]